MTTIELGSEVKDIISGFSGIAVSKHSYVNGCNRITVQPKINKDGTLPEAQTFDEPQLVTASNKKKIKGNNTTGGPEKYSDIRKY